MVEQRLLCIETEAAKPWPDARTGNPAVTIIKVFATEHLEVKKWNPEVVLLDGNKNAERWEAILAPCAAHR